MEQKLHFIGIGGIGMSAIAQIMLGQGFAISGSDVKRSKLTEKLEQAGAVICYGHAPENLPPTTQAVVYSSAVKPDNPELKEARRRGLPIYKRAEMLAYLISCKQGIGVAGAHGKTTVSGMIGTMLEVSGWEPTIIIGGMLPIIDSNAKAGNGPYLVAEADESDGTFLLLKPQIAVVTNVESDHLDHYAGLQEIKEAFAQYLRQVPAKGFAVVCNDCPNLRELVAEIPGTYISYGLEEKADYTARNLAHSPAGIAADVYYQEELLGRLQLAVPGAHNLTNALAAVAIGRALGLPFPAIAKALAYFTGTGRRFEYLGECQGVQVVDDYAHHPSEVAATLQAARDMGAAERIVAVFQPHRYSRTKAMYRDFAAAVVQADAVVIQEIYPAFEAPIAGVSARLIVEAAQEMGYQAIYYAADADASLDLLRRELRPHDMLVVMGAGNIRVVGERFCLESREALAK